MNPCVEWDPWKAAANRRVHGVRFADAATVFEDEFALTSGARRLSDHFRMEGQQKTEGSI
ncbi:BrnT family toxin [Zeimonas arvi]|uniref:BrnT family toxin n=1 Tax=Zeimonas arvi TaxID=2498847 RepID=UPI001CEC2AB1